MSTATIERKVSTNTISDELTTGEILRKVFDEHHLAYDDRSFELCEEIIGQCQEMGYSAYKAATVICQELDIEMRFHVGAIEIALKTNNILK